MGTLHTSCSIYLSLILLVLLLAKSGTFWLMTSPGEAL